MTQPTQSPTWSPPTTDPQPVAVTGPVVQPRSQFDLDLSDPKFGGLRITVQGMTFDEWTDENYGPAVPNEDDKLPVWNKYWRDTADRFADKIVSWNLTDSQGHAVPVSREAVRTFDRLITRALITKWNQGQSGAVEAPLDEPSDSGQPSLEAQIPMETGSSSLAS